jgi:Protein-L-isoaspartate(D-aspartate) O-methyltransferase (PCMT)
VTTVDIEPYVVAAAKTNLRATGFERVEVILGDGGFGYTKNAPYDRIAATVGLWEIPLEWFGQLADGGRIVAPLHLYGEPHEHVYVRLEMEGEHLSGKAVSWLNMVLMRGGAGAHPETGLAVSSGIDVQPVSIAIKVYRRDDLRAPQPHPLDIRGNRASWVLERERTLIALALGLADANA